MPRSARSCGRRSTTATATADAAGLLRLGPVKLYADDVIEPHTALMLEDYANRPGVRGRPSYPGR